MTFVINIFNNKKWDFFSFYLYTLITVEIMQHAKNIIVVSNLDHRTEV